MDQDQLTVKVSRIEEAFEEPILGYVTLPAPSTALDPKNSWREVYLFNLGIHYTSL